MRSTFRFGSPRETKMGLLAGYTANRPESWSPLAKKQPPLLFIRSSAAIRKGPVGPEVQKHKSLRMEKGHERTADGKTDSGYQRSSGG